MTTASIAATATAGSSTSTSTSTQPKRTTKETHPNLPPGLILDENGKVCKVCNSWQDWAKVKQAKPSGSTSSSSSSSKAAGAGPVGMMSALASMGSAATTKPASTAPTDRSRKDCPPDTALLGRSTWTFLHTTAAYYPLTASTEQQGQMRNLLSSLSLLYPCTWCATDFRSDIAQNPPAVSGRAELSKWLCERHNEVNRKLGKQEFGCTVEKLDERWKDGPADGRCD